MSDFFNIPCPEPDIVQGRIQNKEDIYLYLSNNSIEFHRARMLGLRFHLDTNEIQLLAIYMLLLNKEKYIKDMMTQPKTYIFDKGCK